MHEVLIDGDVESLKILPAGSTLADRYSLVTRERIDAVLDKLRTDADTIIVAAPSIAETTEAQLVCAAADATILVVTRGSSRAGDVTSAAEVLAKAHAVLLGAVLIDGTNGKQRGRRSARRQTRAQHRTPGPSARTNNSSQAPGQQPASQSRHRTNRLEQQGLPVVAGVRTRSRAESAPMTGSFARTSPQAEGSRPQGWMSAPDLRRPRAAGCDVPSPRASGSCSPAKLFLILLVVVVIATALWMDRTPTRLRGIGAVEWAMALYLMWNVYSMFAPHKYAAIIPLDRRTLQVPRFIMIGTVIPFVMYVVGRYTFDRTAAVRVLLWTILTLAAYSAAVSIMQFTGPTAWVWPRFIVDGSLNEDETWAGRAVGVFNQPVVNGMMLALGFAVAMLLISRRSEPAWRRCLAFVIAVACGFGIYLTHTRAAWLSAAVMLIIGALLARGYRKGFIAALGITATIIAINWSVFTSTDREAGGVALRRRGRGSAQQHPDSALGGRTETHCRLGHRPVPGRQHLPPSAVGPGHAVDTWLWRTPRTKTSWGFWPSWALIGLALWICVLALIAYRLWNAYRTLPDDDLCGKPLAVTAIIAMAILVCSGLDCRPPVFRLPDGHHLLARRNRDRLVRSPQAGASGGGWRYQRATVAPTWVSAGHRSTRTPLTGNDEEHATMTKTVSSEKPTQAHSISAEPSGRSAASDPGHGCSSQAAVRATKRCSSAGNSADRWSGST